MSNTGTLHSLLSLNLAVHGWNNFWSSFNVMWRLQYAVIASVPFVQDVTIHLFLVFNLKLKFNYHLSSIVEENRKITLSLVSRLNHLINWMHVLNVYGLILYAEFSGQLTFDEHVVAKTIVL